MACWSSTGMSFKTKRHGRSRREESRCSATHFRCPRELRQRRRVGWITPRLPCSLICHMLLTEAEVRSLERDNLLATLQAAKWKVRGPGGAAELLGVKPATLYSRMQKLGIKPPESQDLIVVRA